MTPLFPSNFNKPPFRIEDLLGREQIELGDWNIRQHIFNKRILITGAAGSIGSELAQQIAFFRPSELILIDKHENNLITLDNTLRRMFGADLNINLQYEDITDYKTLFKVFKITKPQIVYHTAAMKHVPFVEKFAAAAIKINIIGTQNLADISAKMKVEKFVFVSSDKAVNPSSIMGATKRFGELIMLMKKRTCFAETEFVSTRFGNVLGSSGSVIPVFGTQLAYEKCLYVTHPEVERYFMTPFEAGQLVLEAGAMGKDGQVLIFDMGQQIRIYDLATRFIQLHGFQPHTEVPIVITGLRPGEKLCEELKGKSDCILPSHHPRIMIARLEMSSAVDLERQVALLEKASMDGNISKIIALLKIAVPEYVPAAIV